MDPNHAELIKQREINFSMVDCSSALPSSSQSLPQISIPDELAERSAKQAFELLESVNGIIELDHINDDCIKVTYDLSFICLRIIEEALLELGFNLDKSLLCKMRRAVIYYTEETQLVNMGYSHLDSKSTTEIFINQYQQREHGSRDKRPYYYHHVT